MNPAEFGQWYYLIYLVPGGAAMVTLLVAVMGGGHHQRVGHGVRVAAHHHHGAGGGHRGGGGHRSHGGGRSGGGRGARSGGRTQGADRLADQALYFLGFGRIPGPFVWSSLLLGWSIFGFWATRTLEVVMHSSAMFSGPALAAAVTGALLTARLSGSVIARMMPKDESNALSNVELAGLTGTVAYKVDDTRGRVHVYDQHGTMHDCSARTAGKMTISRGSRIMVVDYDADHDQLIVEESA